MITQLLGFGEKFWIKVHLSLIHLVIHLTKYSTDLGSSIRSTRRLYFSVYHQVIHSYRTWHAHDWIPATSPSTHVPIHTSDDQYLRNKLARCDKSSILLYWGLCSDRICERIDECVICYHSIYRSIESFESIVQVSDVFIFKYGLNVCQIIAGSCLRRSCGLHSDSMIPHPRAECWTALEKYVFSVVKIAWPLKNYTGYWNNWLVSSLVTTSRQLIPRWFLHFNHPSSVSAQLSKKNQKLT